MVLVDEALLRMQQIMALKRPTKRTQRNVYNIVMNTESLVADEADWIREGPDLAALGYGGDHGWLNAVLEDVFNFVSRRFTKVSTPLNFSTWVSRINNGMASLPKCYRLYVA